MVASSLINDTEIVLVLNLEDINNFCGARNGTDSFQETAVFAKCHVRAAIRKQSD